ncbi:efflux MFS transporter YdeE [Buttiauxella selenatireducens]|uniref:Efflux MFS transporter YdeE n=1 Tax=Buttiauxella selenatireducens TaxID=3073902 RepID=A0ABY9SGH7_9ENTR|nr:efflux MFS transporter YdeE [Buttiauxella sp. R73]WMY76604.1 efflux MFS transporter YdeE [Buttiauxella sp. R73]
MVSLASRFSGKHLSISVLLLSSLLLTVGRGLTLPFMTIYLSRNYNMPLTEIGMALTIALTTGVVFSLWFGILADKFDKKKCMLLAIIIFLGGFVAIPLVSNAILVVVFYSLINCAYSVFATVLKGYFADTLETHQKPKIFSLNYTFANIGWTVGPPIGTLAVLYSTNLPFWLSGLTAIIPFIVISRYVHSVPVSEIQQSSTRLSPSLMLKDKALMYFTLSAFLGSLVFGSFAACLSQYAIAISDSDLAQKVVGVVLPVNAFVVVVFQYMVGKRIRPDNIQKLMFYGTLFFMAGLAGFMISGDNLLLWGLSAAVFTIGELIFAPGEYMLVDNIAPPGLKASYFSAQQLGWLGGACNPLFTGLMLTWMPPFMLFVVLMVAILLAYLMVVKGIAVKPQRVMA